MNMKSYSLSFLLVLLLGKGVLAQQPMPQLGKNPIPEVVAAMTLEEKVSILVGPGMNMPGMNMPGMGGGTISETQKRVPGAAGVINGIPRLGIPSVVVCDGPSGVHPFNVGFSRAYYATAWPTATLLASSWDTTLVKQVGSTFGKEAKEYGIDIVLGPGMNIHRNPLGGRNFEYYSEDPLITGSLAGAMINGIQSNGVGTSPKHFMANNQESNRNTVNTIVSERALREIYLRGWEIMVKQSNPWTIMSSYNLVNGPYTSENKELLTTILRDEWGFKGLVMTDWFGGRNPVAQQEAGNNLIMPGTPVIVKTILEGVRSGKLDEKVLDKNVAGILSIIMSTPTYAGYKYSDHPDLKANARVARTAAAESIVLLKNQGGTLPVAPGTSVAVLGNNGYELIAGGTGSGDVTRMYTVSLSEGLFKGGFIVHPELQLAYTGYLETENAKRPKKSPFEEFFSPHTPINEYPIADELLARAATQSAIAIVGIGRNAGEGTDRKVDGNYYLTDAEKTFIKRVSSAFHAQNKKVVVVFNVASVTDVSQWQNDVDAIVLAYHPGLEGGNALADIISGRVNPSGKLASTFPAAYADDPTGKNFPGKEFSDRIVQGAFGQKAFEAEVVYEEGVYVGYRFYNTFGVKPAYEFGYGLSYTEFNYSPLKLGAAEFNQSITATITITNAGKVAGKEVVQLYLSAPATKLDKPAAELKGFTKTRLLQPGESQTVTFTLHPMDLASYATKLSTWVADAGTYTVRVGTSQTTKQQASFKLKKDILVLKTTKSLAPKVLINELKPLVKK
jgi:beta-glucosidase